MRALLDPLLGAIERLHAEGVFHRDIAPDNIQIEPDGRPVLLDFGAARRVISDKTQSLTAILKPAYAPIEQYAEAGSVKQGPWTDLYALGATMHYVLLGRPPLPATARAVHDDLPPLSAQQLPGCSAEFLNVIDWMLAPRPADRPQSVAAVRDVLAGKAPAPRRMAEPVAPGSWERTIVHAPAAAAAPSPPPERTYAATMVMPPRDAPPAPPPAAGADRLPPAGVAPAPAPRSRLLPVLLGLAVVAVVGAAVTYGLRSGGAESPQAAASAPDMAPVAASAPAVAPPVADVVVPPAPVEQAPVVAPTRVTVAPTPAPPADKKPPPARVASPVVTNAPGPAPAPVLQAAPASPPVQTETAQPARTPPAQPPPLAAPAATVRAPAPQAAGPEATCAGSNPLAYFVCMERECLRSELGANQHPDCRKWRANKPAENPTF
jgi:hypothetical protein